MFYLFFLILQQKELSIIKIQMKMKHYFLISMLALSSAAALTSCSNNDVDFYDPAKIEADHKQKYADNFVAKYGEISSTQKWDFTTGEVQLTRGFTSISVQVLDQGIDWGDVSQIKTTVKDSRWLYSEIQIPGGVEKNAQLLDAMVQTLPEKKKQTGKPAVLVAPASGFYIFPLFSGGCLTFDLKVKVGDQEPVLVFSKDWINFQTINGMAKDTIYADGSPINMKGVYIQAPVGTPVEVYIDNIYDHTPVSASKGRAFPSPCGTTNGRAVYVDIPEGIKPELNGIELKENAMVKYIGIEDITNPAPQTGDDDFNDVVLAVVGNPDIPQESIITQDKYEVPTTRTKRYMIEDLGAIDDFDFNDVVVDVEENTVTTHTVTYENGVLKTDVVSNVTSAPGKAIIRCMGGTLDFELTIGNTTWVKSEKGFNVTKMYNSQGAIDYDAKLAEFEVTGWNYDANNVGMKVNGENGQVYNITFPRAGTAPMIIAVDPTQPWMTERTSVPRDWFYE